MDNIETGAPCVCILWRGGGHVLCMQHGIPAWQHIGQSTTATSRHRRDYDLRCYSDVKRKQTVQTKQKLPSALGTQQKQPWPHKLKLKPGGNAFSSPLLHMSHRQIAPRPLHGISNHNSNYHYKVMDWLITHDYIMSWTQIHQKSNWTWQLLIQYKYFSPEIDIKWIPCAEREGH